MSESTKTILNLIKTRRSIRRFSQKPISDEILRQILDCARLAPSSGNFQPLEYIAVTDENLRKQVFRNVMWAAHVDGKRNPPKGMRPTAYIVVLINENIKKDRHADAAAAIQNILLSAWHFGIGSCWLGSTQREQIMQILNIPDNFHIESVVAVGYPEESPILEELMSDCTNYYLDENDKLHVPKRKLADISHFNGFGRAFKK